MGGEGGRGGDKGGNEGSATPPANRSGDPWRLGLQQRWLGADGTAAWVASRLQGLRQDWQTQGYLVWPRGNCTQSLHLHLKAPPHWQQVTAGTVTARLVLRWWAERAELRLNGRLERQGDLFDAACRLPLPARWLAGSDLEVTLELQSPWHDEGALLHSHVVLEPGHWQGDRLQLLKETGLALGNPEQQGSVTILGHAHLDLAWLWPVANTWEAAVATFSSVLELMEQEPQLHFGHSTPALYDWLRLHRPRLWQRIRDAAREGRWEPLNGPWVETDCVLVSTSSLLRQFARGQAWSRQHFPEWEHDLAWLPDSFGFSSGLPQIVACAGIRWFLTSKLSWNHDQPFPHRLFRWRDWSGRDVLCMMVAGIGSDGDPLAIQQAHRRWQEHTGDNHSLWLPGVGNHGGGPSRDMLDQLRLWWDHPRLPRYSYGTMRGHLCQLEPLAAALPVWKDELYLELHRGCSTTRPDQKYHNRVGERLLLEAERALWREQQVRQRSPAAALAAALQQGWDTLMFHQFHDILPGTSIAEVFCQAEPEWRHLQRRASAVRNQTLQDLVAARPGSNRACTDWVAVQLQPCGPWERVVTLPAARTGVGASTSRRQVLPAMAGIGYRRLSIRTPPAPPRQPVRSVCLGHGRWRLDNGRCVAECGPGGILQLWAFGGPALLAEPLALRRWADSGEFWDAWNIAPGYRQQPLPLMQPGQPEVLERNPWMVRLRWRGHYAASSWSLVACLAAGSPYLELRWGFHWQQVHELLRLEATLKETVLRWAADQPGGVIERPGTARTGRERSRWECTATSWMAAQQQRGGLAVLLDGPQGVDVDDQRVGVSLLRGPTWPDASANRGWWRLRLALMPLQGNWCRELVPAAADHLRWPLWLRPAASGQALKPHEVWLAWPEPQQRLLVLRPGEHNFGNSQLTVQNLAPWRGDVSWLATQGWAAQGALEPWEIRRFRPERPSGVPQSSWSSKGSPSC